MAKPTRKLCIVYQKLQGLHKAEIQPFTNRLKAQQTYSIPHDYVDISAEGIINMLRNIKIDEITEVMVHINTWERKNC